MQRIMMHPVLENNLSISKTFIQFGCVFSEQVLVLIQYFKESDMLWMQGMMLHPILSTMCGGPRRYDHDHRFFGFLMAFLSLIPNKMFGNSEIIVKYYQPQPMIIITLSSLHCTIK